ncbi:nucleoside deaminase [Pedobacter psychrodurus]|jgi:tRNA(adenine34) deaminase|uniref:nucleoside deaminase n=1 Tax=Pedobacter psychrodurus TaxID=2530456 RepID=UPI00292E63D6|nr:nucleoside deaminase [Pedobacter psychrodurus]
MQEDDQYYMHQCLDLAKIALAAGDPPVGVVIVFEGKIIGTGIESGKTTGDITNHAEILAVRDAIKNGYLDQLQMSVMYTTHEPCIMCAYVIRHHRIPEIIYGTAVPFVGGSTSKFNILATQDVPKWGAGPKIIDGICLKECIQLNEDFKKRLAKS